MQCLFATFTVSDRLLHALSWTLLHSLWQGAIVALCAGILFFGTAYLSARIRYHLLLGLMVLFVGMVGLTFGAEWDEYEKRSNETPELLAEFQYEGTTVTSIFAEPETIHLDKKQPWVQLFERYKGLLLFAWGLILLFKSLKMSLDLAYIYRIRKVQTRPMDASWNARLQALSKRLGITQKVGLLESGIIPGPASLGVFKPLILLPIGMINHLTVAQVEAILLHELAHIRRSDYLVNVLQRLLENVFFFNPALLWLSHRIREERENCCDDLALQVLQDKQLYAQTLLRFQEYQWREPQYVQAFGGNKMPLLTRIKRILNRQDYRALQVYEKVALIFSLLVVGVFLMWAKPLQPSETYMNEQQKEQSSIPSATDVPAQGAAFSALPRKGNLDVAQTNLNSTTQQLQSETTAQPNSLHSALPLKDSIPTVTTELAQLHADLALAKRQYEQEQAKYDSIKAYVDQTVKQLKFKAFQRAQEEAFQRTQEERVKSRDLVREMLLEDLIADGIIKDKEQLRSYLLDKNTFKVNGHKQTTALMQIYQQKYLRNKTTGNVTGLILRKRTTSFQREDTSNH